MMNTCRVCLKNETSKSIPLGELIESRSVAEMIHFCSGIEISLYDNFPQTVCRECFQALLSACRTKETCIESDKILKCQIKNEEILMSPEVVDTRTENLDLERLKDEVKEEPHTVFLDNNYYDLAKSHAAYQSELPYSSTRRKSRSESQETGYKGTYFKQKRDSKLNFKCYLCNMEFRLRKEKYRHLESNHVGDELRCKLCKHKSQTARGLDNHMMLHENPALLSHMCHICSKNYQKACELRRHIKLAHSDKSKREINFHCDHCDFKTFSKMNMKRHLNTIHLKIKAFSCSFCPDKKYTSKITLDQHMITKHDQETDFVCQCCLRKFPTMSFLRSHMKSTCSGSPGAVRERGDPNEYRELLDDLEHYRCKLCGCVFKGKGRISQHYAQRHKHSNACNICAATFNSYSNLKKHIQILHNKIHKYKCLYCERSFGQKNQLQSHVNTHTGDKPFKCKFNFCTFKSGDLSAVSKHQKKCSNNPINNV